MRPKLFLHAALFAALISLPQTIELFRFHGMSPKVFSDWDEPYYFPRALRYGRFILEWALSGGQWPDLLPHEYLTGLLGAAMDVFHLRSSSVAVGLDWAIAFISYLLFSAFYERLDVSPARAESAAFVTLFFPWLLYLPQFIHVPLPPAWHIATIPHYQYPCQPVIRGLSTQLSYPLFGAALLLVAAAVKDRSRGKAFNAGLITSTLPSVYFFAWPATVALAGLYMLISNLPWKEKAVTIGAFLAGLAPLSIYLLQKLLYSLVVVNPVGTAPSAAPVLNESVWYFSVEQFVLLLVLAALAYRFRASNALKICVAALVAEFVLMNSQALLHVKVAPYHFPLIYLHPVLNGILFGLLLSVLRTINLRNLPYLFLVAAAVITQVVAVAKNDAIAADTAEFVGLEREIERYVPKDSAPVFAPADRTSPKAKADYHFYTIPYWAQAITGRPLYSDFVGPGSAGMMDQDLITGWIFTGEFKPFVSCPDKLPSLPGDMLSGMMTREYWERYYVCRNYPAYQAQHPLCELLQAKPFSYVVWQHSIFPTVPAATGRYLTSLWRSASGEYELFRFEKKQALADLCSLIK